MNHNYHNDCLVVGAGPAGLTAALYLYRFLRKVTLVDHGQSRALAIEKTRNYPGHPQGISGPGLLRLMREQLVDGQVEFVHAEVNALRRQSQGGFAAEWGSHTRLFSTVLLATGVVDLVPTLPGIDEVQQNGLLRQCPVCDGYEHRAQRIVVLGDGLHAEREAAFIAHYSPHVTQIGLAMPSGSISGSRKTASVAVGVEVSAAGGVRVRTSDGRQLDFDVAYSAMSVEPRSQLGRALGAEVDATGSLVADSHGATAVHGLYAAGDVVPGLDQLVVAAAQGARAATAIHNMLMPPGPC